MIARPAFVAVHRYVGLTVAVFVTAAGLTGSVLAFRDSIDKRLNPGLFYVRPAAVELPGAELAASIERADPRARVTFATLRWPRGSSASFDVQPRIDAASGKPYVLEYTQVFLDPSNGAWLGTRYAGRLAIDRRHLMPLLYRLHTTLLLPDRAGVWLLATVACVWLSQTMFGLYLTLPRGRPFWKRWARALRIEGGGARRVTLDLHRAGGSWFWMPVIILASTGLCLRLGPDVVRPLLERSIPMTPLVFEGREPRPFDRPIEPALTFGDLIGPATKEASSRGFSDPASSAAYFPEYGVYAVRFHPPGNDDGSFGFGVPAFYFDARTGAFLTAKIPRAGHAGDVFMDLQYPLHSGLVAGLTGKLVVALIGLASAAVSIAGVCVWLQRRRRRLGYRDFRFDEAPHGPERANGIGRGHL